jgi:hypothetical protein
MMFVNAAINESFVDSLWSITKQLGHNFDKCCGIGHVPNNDIF